MNPKILIIRFSSFGDIVQSFACVPELAEQGEIHYLTKESFGALPSLCSEISQVHQFNPKLGLSGLIKLALKLRKEKFQLVYDAHENPRSKIVRFIVTCFTSTGLAIRSKSRWKRFQLFTLKKRNALPAPFKGMVSFCKPVGVNPSLQSWKFSRVIKPERLKELEEYCGQIALVPSAAWDMKRWPSEHWQELVRKLDHQSVVLGGPQDLFCQQISDQSSLSKNLSGKLSLVESCYIVSKSKIVVSADTGLLHVADILGVPVIALIGPTAFGFPTFIKSKVLEMPMDCRPCTKDGRGKCSQPIWQQCMVDISPRRVLEAINSNLPE
tara:strand:+ start:8065 stop:9039 length:975 start_codon:yes stop_codon:yes gene_type:complete